MKRALSGGLLMAFAGACASAPAAPPAPSPPMVSIFTVAHQDDWQLFMNPEAYHGMDEPQEKAVFIHVTAGDAGAGAGQHRGLGGRPGRLRVGRAAAQRPAVAWFATEEFLGLGRIGET